MANIDPQEFGALQAEVKNLTTEIHLLRQEMAHANALINQGKGGLYVLLLTAGAVGSAITLFFKKLVGG